MIFFGESSLRNAVGQFLSHVHGERNHQGLGNKIIDPREEVGEADGEIECHERLAGLLRYYMLKLRQIGFCEVRASGEGMPRWRRVKATEA